MIAAGTSTTTLNAITNQKSTSRFPRGAGPINSGGQPLKDAEPAKHVLCVEVYRDKKSDPAK
jgi:hypothetical protein